MVPWTNLEPATLAVGCELELAPNPFFFAPRYEQKEITRVLGRVQILILARNLDPQLFVGWAEN